MELIHPILRKILAFGVDSVDLNKLTTEQRTMILKHAGNILLHREKYSEAAKAFNKAGDLESLNDNAHWFLEQQKPHIAALFAVYIPKEELLERIARSCVEAGRFDEATMLYVKLHDSAMIQFIYENLRQPATMH